MKNTFGQSFAVTIFGESHGDKIGAVIDGVAPGIQLNMDQIHHQLLLRRPAGKISTARVEQDPFEIVSGVVNEVTTGTPITILIPNSNTHSSDYSALENTPRPAHADYAATCKYHGYEDKRGGGHFSGRITAAVVAAGAIALQILKGKGVSVGSHIQSCAGVKDDNLPENLDEFIEKMNEMQFAVINSKQGELMQKECEKAREALDSVGGVIESVVTGMPAGVGEPFFDSVESVLSHLIYSVPAVKGVEFGDGFALADMKGSISNDGFEYVDGQVRTITNHMGGINGGITNGMPIIVRTAVKPTPSIYQKQKTVDLVKKENTEIEINGRHDPAIVHRARVVIDSMIAIGLVDLCSVRFGTDWQKGN